MGNVYMEADQVRFKDSTYRNVQEGLAAALEGGGGGGTTVVANPEGTATADLAKLQVGTTIYGIPSEAGEISYDNTSSGLTADDVQEAVDELNTGLSGVTELIPSGATSSNKLATASDIPDAVTGNPSGSATAGNLTKLQIGDDIYNVPSGGGGEVYSETETVIGTWLGNTLYRKVVDFGALPNTADLAKSVNTGLTNVFYTSVRGIAYTHPAEGDTVSLPLPFVVGGSATSGDIQIDVRDNNVGHVHRINITVDRDRSAYSAYVVLEYIKTA